MDIITGERNDLEKQDYSLTSSQKHSHNKEKKEKNLITIMGKTDILI